MQHTFCECVRWGNLERVAELEAGQSSRVVIIVALIHGRDKGSSMCKSILERKDKDESKM